MTPPTFTETNPSRACVACPAVYVGGIKCPDCGEPGEPLAPPECIYCGSGDLRYDPASNAVDCVGCGES